MIAYTKAILGEQIQGSNFNWTEKEPSYEHIYILIKSQPL